MALSPSPLERCDVPRRRSNVRGLRSSSGRVEAEDARCRAALATLLVTTHMLTNRVCAMVCAVRAARRSSDIALSLSGMRIAVYSTVLSSGK